MNLDMALKYHPAVWLVGEPEACLEHAAKTLPKSAVTAEGAKAKIKFWNIANGAIDGVWSEKTKEPIRNEAELMLTMCDKSVGGIIAFVDGLRMGPSLVAATLKVIHDDRRVIFVSSNEPPADFIPDYLRVVDQEKYDLEDLVKKRCTENKVKFDPVFLPPLRGLRPYKAETILLEAFVLSPNNIVKYLYEGRRETVERESGGVLKLVEPKERFADLIGLNRAKELMLAVTRTKEAAKGVMLLGVPGTGKTKLVYALAGESGLPLYVLDVGAVFGSYVGESERRARESLRLLRNLPRGIVLLDEVEKLFASLRQGQSTGDSGVGMRTGAYYLKYLDDPAAFEGNHIVAGTSNDVFSLPPEYTRAGRWNALFWFGIPKPEQQVRVLEMYRAQYKRSKTFGENADMSGLTPAEIEATCQVAAIIESNDWEKALSYVPKLMRFRKDDMEKMEKQFEGAAVSAEGPDQLGNLLGESSRRARK
jgi:hypothetical protein